MRRPVLLIAGALASIALAPAAAQALTLARADFEGTNGYAIRIDAIAGSVSVAAKDDGAGARYTVKASVGRRHMEADLGPFGSIDLEFQPRSEGKCKGPFKVRRGTWSGVVQFVAETGFTSASATEMSGETKRPNARCARRNRGGQDDAAFLIVMDRRLSAEPETFIGFADVPGRKPNIFASQSRTEGGIEISNFASDRLGRSRFRFDRKGRRATVRPHAPFSGRGVARGRKWRGDLTVTMPATGEIPLTGRRFFAIFDSLDLGRPFAP
jgi:hypothetical protein